MNNKKFHLICFLLLAAFAVVSVGGCGGSSSSGGGSSNKPSTTLDKNYDSDGNGKPDILEVDEDVTQQTVTSGTVIQNMQISSIPARILIARQWASAESAENFETAEDSVVSGEITDTFKASLTKGIEYTVEVSRGENYDKPIGNRLKNLEILNPSGTALKFFDIESGSSLKEDEIELSVYPVDEPYMICLTFTPSVTGDYTLQLTHVISEDDDMTIFVYEELRNETDNSAGYYTRYKLTDNNGNESATLNMNDIMALRKAYNELESVYERVVLSDDARIEDDELTKETIEAAAAYLDVLRDLKQQYGIFDDYIENEKYTKGKNSYASAVSDADFSIAATVMSGDANGTVVPAEIYGIKYEDNYDLGMGFFGITGTQAQNRAVLKSVIKNGIAPSKQKKEVKSLYKAAFVSSQEDSERLTATTVDGGIQLGGFGFSAGHSSSNSFKYGLTSTTFVIHYEETEKQYRMLDDDEEYQLNSKGKRMLKEGSKAFRTEFGDYFVGGYQYGGTFDAFITITTKTTEQLEKAKTNLSTSFETEDLALSSDVANKSKNFLKTNDAEITIEVRTAGISDDGSETTKKLTDLTQIADSLLKFKQQLKKTTPAEFQPVYVMLKRFRLLPDVFDKMLADKDNGLIPIPASHSTKVMNFRKDMGTMHAYYNIIRDTDNTTMDQGVKDAYRRRYDKINNTVAAEGPTTLYEVSNAAKLDQLHKDMLKLNNELKAVGDRFVFYKLLMVEQTKEASLNNGNGTENVTNKPYGSGGGTIGYRSFQSSKVVQSDISAGTEQKDEINQFSGSEWTPSFNAGQDFVFNHIEVIANNINDYRRKANPPCVGSQSASFYFRCGGSRWLQWTVKVHSMRFDQKRYPFSGLK